MAQNKPPLTVPDDGLEKPKRLSEVPGYLARRVAGFTKRLFYIISLVWEASPGILIAMIILSALSGVLPIVGAYIAKDLLNAINGLIGTGEYGGFWSVIQPILFLLIVQFIYLFVNRVMGRINNMVTAIAGEVVVNHIRLKIITKAKSVDLASFDSPGFYEKLENANREASMRPIRIMSATFSVISSTISVIGFIAVLATLSPWAPLIIVAASIPGALVNYYYRNRNFKYLRKHSKERRQMNYYSDIMVNKDNVKEIKLLDLGNTVIDKYNGAFARYYRGLKGLILREGFTQVIVSLVYMIASCALFAYVAYSVVGGSGQIGDYSLYTGALNSITSYVSTIVTATATIYEGTLFINNMLDFLHEKQTVTPSVTPPLLPEYGKRHTIEFRAVSFRYPGTERDVIHNFSLTVSSGESLVLVGLNGAGKTTLIKLMTRLYDPTEGEVLLDGHDIKEYDVSALYRLYGIVFQDFGKYADTVSENIRFGDVYREPTEENIVSAAHSGNADGFIERLPDGYETPLTRMFEDDGIELSGGQWQKLSLARAFYREADIIILDEPTSALDAMAEQEVYNRFYELSRDKISVFVSHRLSSAVTATKIAVINLGELTELGTHSELMAKRGEYYKLFTTQARRYTAATENGTTPAQ